MKNSILFVLLLLLISLSSCSRSHVPDGPEIDELVKGGDLKAILELKAEYQDIMERGKVGKASPEELAKLEGLRQILEYSARSIIKYGDSTFYSSFGGLFDATSNRFYERHDRGEHDVVVTPYSVFNTEAFDNIKKNYRYLPPMWINVTVKDMLIDPSLYQLFLEEFARRRNLSNSKDNLFFTIALERAADYTPGFRSKDDSEVGIDDRIENSTELPNMIIKYNDLLDDTKYKNLKSLCKQIRPLMKDRYKYIVAYNKYEEKYRKYTDIQRELRSLANNNPYGMSSGTLDEANSLGVQLREAQQWVKISERDLDGYTSKLNSYKDLEKKIIKEASQYASPEYKKVIEMPL